MLNQHQSVQELVREAEKHYTSGFSTTLSKYVDFDLYDNINKIDAYINSKHISGSTDSKGREKPFFNIVTAAINIWYRATDIDRSNISIRATKRKNKITSFLYTLLLQDWMKKNNFGMFLNEWGRTLSKYGSAVCKFVEKGGELYSEVIPWSRLIVDAVDFENNPVIEKLYFTPSQLKKNKNYDQDFVEELIEKASSVRETVGNDRKDNKDSYIPVYEVHGELPLSYLTDDEDDEDEYVQQMHIVCFIQSKEMDNNGKYRTEDFTLYRGKEAKSPYMLTHLIPEDGRTMAIGSVENLFEAQWMLNHTVKGIKDQLDLASKLIFQTSDGNFAGRNALSSIDNGDILIHAQNQPLTNLANSSHDITSLQAFGQQWQALGNQINGISEAMLGTSPKAGTAWRQTQALLQESHSLFEVMTENKGLYLEDMLRKFILPNLKKKMDTTEEISTILSEQQIKKIDLMYVPNEAIRRVNKKIINNILNKTPEDIMSGNLYQPEQQATDIQNEANNIQKDLLSDGNQRFIKPSEIETKTWKEVLKDVEDEIEIDITGEPKDVQGALATLGTAMQTIAGLQGAPMPPEMKTVFNKILELTGTLNPIEITQGQMINQPMPQMQGQPVPQMPQQV
jgi:hypothetical protein